MRALTQRDLNRALLARQLLLERSRTGIPRALERIGGLRAQYAPSMYIGLWSRLDGLEREKLTRALERRTVVQGTLMRATIHLVSARDYWPFTMGIRRIRRESWRKSPRGRDLSDVARQLGRRLADGPLGQAEVDEVLGGDPAVRNGVGLFVDLVRVPPSGTLGAAACRSLRLSRALARPHGGHAGERSRAPRAPLSGRLRASAAG